MDLVSSYKGTLYHNLSADKLARLAIRRKEAVRHQSGALVVYTGAHTGRAPRDNYKVRTPTTETGIDWGTVNQPLAPANFERLHKKMTAHLAKSSDLFVTDGLVGADPAGQVHVRVITTHAYLALFAHHLFIRPTQVEAEGLRIHPTQTEAESPTLTILAAPDCTADPDTDGTRSPTFVVSNYDDGIVLIGGTKYAGEIKKCAFTYLNYLLPTTDIFPMHCSANRGQDGQTALFFGLSGTGKTTLSADPRRSLIGDDEHGWSRRGIYNFEGGCYAKVVNLSEAKEPLIWNAVHQRDALLENVTMHTNGNFDFTSTRYTENTRGAYPLSYIDNSLPTRIYPHPSYIIFLTADATGVLPAVARLDQDGALYYFLSGYTSKIPGTEVGVSIPQPTFSHCFGAPFMPRNPLVYADLLRACITRYKTRIYLVNTGWQKGPYGTGGERVSIVDTRRIITAILSGELDTAHTTLDQYFNVHVPLRVRGVDPQVLSPKNTWKDAESYDREARALVEAFRRNFGKFRNVPKGIVEAGPVVRE